MSALARSLWNRLRRPRTRLHQGLFENVLGTSLEVQVHVERAAAAEHAEQAALGEIRRLERIFSIFQDSELLRWTKTFQAPVRVSPELASALEAAEYWRLRTGGAFDPRTERQTRHWQARESESSFTPAPVGTGSPATAAEVGPLWVVEKTADEALATRLTREPISLNAVAKGLIIDAACEAVMSVPGVIDAIVNIGGDIRYIGARPIRIGITDPRTGAENVPPIASVALASGGLATSGAYRRGFRIAGEHRSHIIDPLTGEPADRVRSVTVVAECAADADALATACCVLGPEAGSHLVDSIPGTAAFFVTDDGEPRSSSNWSTFEA